jgi:hypothetical protein
VSLESARTALRVLKHQFGLRRHGFARHGSPDVQEFANNQATLLAATEAHQMVLLGALQFFIDFAQMTPECRADEVSQKAALWDVIENGYAYYGRPGQEGEHIREATIAILDQMQRTAAREAKRTVGRPKNSY